MGHSHASPSDCSPPHVVRTHDEAVATDLLSYVFFASLIAATFLF